jgi:hypothetical protein
MTILTRLNLRGNNVNINSRKAMMELSRVKAGTLQVLLSPCLVFVSRSVCFTAKNFKSYLDAGCCVYRHGYYPVYPELKYYPGLVPVQGGEDVRILGKGTTQFLGIGTTSTVVGECYCPAGSKGYYELEVITGQSDDLGIAKFGFCSKKWVLNVQKSVGKDKTDENSETWSIVLGGEGDQEVVKELQKGDVIGLGCEVYANARADPYHPAWQDYDPERAPKSMDESCSKSTSKTEGEDQLLSAEQIYNLEPGVWESDAVSRSETGGGEVRVWIHNKINSSRGVECEPVKVFNLPTGLKGLCPFFSFATGSFICKLGGKGCDSEFHSQPAGYNAMGSFPPIPITPNMAGVFTVLHNPTSLPVSPLPS